MLGVQGVKNTLDGQSQVIWRVLRQRIIMLPQPATSPRSKNSFVDVSVSKRYKYLKRIFKWGHMDFEFALWQMVYLCCAPRRVSVEFLFIAVSNIHALQFIELKAFVGEVVNSAEFEARMVKQTAF